jgi:hypothetical protein
MRPIEFIKTTVFCGVTAWLAFNFPALSQGLIIALLSTLWLTYLYSTVTKWRQH